MQEVAAKYCKTVTGFAAETGVFPENPFGTKLALYLVTKEKMHHHLQGGKKEWITIRH